MTIAAWADAADVLLWTGIEVADDAVMRAQDIIELYASTTYVAVDISPKNLRHLNRAVAYQAGWMSLNPDLYISRDVDSASVDGSSYTPAHESAHLLAPLARRHIRQLTWKQAPLRVRRRYGQMDYSELGDRDSAARDDAFLWQRL
jgi:hypothetical protein